MSNNHNLKPFKKGQSGNPKGRPKGAKNRSTIIALTLIAAITYGEPVAYQTTDEGALAWIDGITLSAKAENIDEAYELINYSFTPEVGGQTINEIGYNSAVNGKRIPNRLNPYRIPLPNFYNEV